MELPKILALGKQRYSFFTLVTGSEDFTVEGGRIKGADLYQHFLGYVPEIKEEPITEPVPQHTIEKSVDTIIPVEQTETVAEEPVAIGEAPADSVVAYLLRQHFYMFVGKPDSEKIAHAEAIIYSLSQMCSVPKVVEDRGSIDKIIADNLTLRGEFNDRVKKSYSIEDVLKIIPGLTEEELKIGYAEPKEGMYDSVFVREMLFIYRDLIEENEVIQNLDERLVIEPYKRKLKVKVEQAPAPEPPTIKQTPITIKRAYINITKEQKKEIIGIIKSLYETVISGQSTLGLGKLISKLDEKVALPVLETLEFSLDYLDIKGEPCGRIVKIMESHGISERNFELFTALYIGGLNLAANAVINDHSKEIYPIVNRINTAIDAYKQGMTLEQIQAAVGRI